MDEYPKVHITDVATFLSCRAKWDWTSPHRQSLMLREPNKHMWLGRVIHYALAAYYGTALPRPATALKQAFITEGVRSLNQLKADYGEIPEPLKEYAQLGVHMMNHYALWAPQYDDFETIMPEVPLQVSMGEWVFSGQTDGLIRDSHGDLWLFESKTSSRIPSESVVSMAWQGPAYVIAARRDPSIKSIGRVKGVLYNFLLKAKPTAPNELMSGGLSKRSNLRSTTEAYMEEVRKHGLDPEDYVEYASKLRKGLFFRRYYIEYTDYRLEHFEEDMHHVVYDMLNSPHIYPQDSFRSCPGCEFVEVCKARYSGRPYEDLIHDDFVRSDYYQLADGTDTDEADE